MKFTSAEDIVAWPRLKAMTRRVFRGFRWLPGAYLELEDFHSIGAMAIWEYLKEDPDAGDGFLLTVARYRMVNYGRAHSDRKWKAHVEKEPYHHMVSIDAPLRSGEPFDLPGGLSPLDQLFQEPVDMTFPAWLKAGNYGLTPQDVEVLRVRYWDVEQYPSYVDRFGYENLRASINRAKRKIRAGLGFSPRARCATGQSL